MRTLREYTKMRKIKNMYNIKWYINQRKEE
jgi:hypothetical protein